MEKENISIIMVTDMKENLRMIRNMASGDYKWFLEMSIKVNGHVDVRMVRVFTTSLIKISMRVHSITDYVRG